jgi:hypothetical protein
MAVIVQADPYQALCRKIGYSVGLEKLVERVNELVLLYVHDKGLSAGSFRDLVRDEFGRDEVATEHFANFYSTLNLVRVMAWTQIGGLPSKKKSPKTPKVIEPLYQLDSGSILRRLLPNDTEFEKALKVVLTQAVVEADGDIFLNALMCNFKPEDMTLRFEKMVSAKRERLLRVMPTQSPKIREIVNIKNETGLRKNSQTQLPAKGRFSGRTEPLESFRRTAPLTAEIDQRVVVPEDYVSKVRISRSSWAEDLGWFAEGTRTPAGLRLLDSIERDIVSTVAPPPTILFWGYRSDLEKIRLNPKDIDARSCEPWDLLSVIVEAYVDQKHDARTDSLGDDHLIELLREVYKLYRDGNSTKGLIRNSLPRSLLTPSGDHAAMLLFCRLANLFVFPFVVGGNERRFKKAVYLFIDEMDELVRCSAKEAREINGLLRHIYDQCPNCFFLGLGLTGTSAEIGVMFADQVLSRVSRQIVLDFLQPEEAKVFVKDILNSCRVDPKKKVDYFPFTEEAVETCVSQIVSITPRKVIDRMLQVLEECRLAKMDPSKAAITTAMLDKQKIWEMLG